MLHLTEEHRVAEVEIRGGGVEAGFHPERLAFLLAEEDTVFKVFLADELREPFLEVSQLFIDGGGHWTIVTVGMRDGYNSHVEAVNVAELKNRLSHYLRKVKDGEEVVIRDRDVPIARIVPIEAGDYDAERQGLIAAGKIRPARKPITEESARKLFSIGADLPRIPGIAQSLVKAVVDERSEGW
jgi:prevent-host-death family protein